jgi:redox-sensitive bicupin YhaK (pirin superfamily)
MIFHRVSDSRGIVDIGWLKSFHTFSFADYYDPQFMGFSVLRVINEDYIAAAKGFPTHGHKDMEIITYMVEGVLEHKDTLGNAQLLRAGEVQRMTAGTGVRHSEVNFEKSSQAHLLQIWIVPQVYDLAPSYQQKSFAANLESKQLTLLVSSKPDGEALTIHQDVQLYGFKSSEQTEFSKNLSITRKYYLQVVKGTPHINNLRLSAGDGLAFQQESHLHVLATQGCEFLFFDLPS